MDLRANVAMITGGASGLGAATARELVAQGARVAVLDLDRPLGAAHIVANPMLNGSIIRLDGGLRVQPSAGVLEP